MRTVFKIENGYIDPVNLAEKMEALGTLYRLITDGRSIDLTSPFISAMIFTSVDVHSLMLMQLMKMHLRNVIGNMYCIRQIYPPC